MTEQFATWLVVAFIIDPRNNYTWWEVRNNAQHRREFLEAVQQEAADIPRVLEACDLADWSMVMRMLMAASRTYFKA